MFALLTWLKHEREKKQSILYSSVSVSLQTDGSGLLFITVLSFTLQHCVEPTEGVK